MPDGLSVWCKLVRAREADEADVSSVCVCQTFSESRSRCSVISTKSLPVFPIKLGFRSEFVNDPLVRAYKRFKVFFRLFASLKLEVSSVTTAIFALWEFDSSIQFINLIHQNLSAPNLLDAIRHGTKCGPSRQSIADQCNDAAERLGCRPVPANAEVCEMSQPRRGLCSKGSHI